MEITHLLYIQHAVQLNIKQQAQDKITIKKSVVLIIHFLFFLFHIRIFIFIMFFIFIGHCFNILIDFIT